MKSSVIIIFLIVGASLYQNAHAQDNMLDSTRLNIENSVNNLFIAMRDADSVLLKSVLHDELTLMTVFNDKSGQEQIHKESVQEFITTIGKPHEYVYNEQINNVIIHYDDRLAHAWMDYEFFLDENFSHCGVNAMTLVEENNVWKIISIVDTRRRKDCD